MKAWLDFGLWWPLPGAMALGVAVLVVIAGVLHHGIRAAAWRRTIWQACLVGLLALVLLELSGAARPLARLLRPRAEALPKPVPKMTGATTLQPFDQVQPAETEPAGVLTDSATAISQNPSVTPGQAIAGIPAIVGQQAPAGAASRMKFVAWVVLLWLLGTGVVLARTMLSHLLFLFCRRRHLAMCGAELNERVRRLSQRMPGRRVVRIVESPQFAGPIAFGLLRPTIGLPAGFAADHPPAQQEVMLAHELAHLHAGDPIWHLLADITTALLWWHPLVWWARRQLHTTSEAAADEASLVIKNGPAVLAECLVTLGKHLSQAGARGWMGIDGGGFQSGLGRRVERLLDLRERVWSLPNRMASALARTIGPAALVLATVAGMARALPESSNHGTIMKPWKQALLVLTLATGPGQTSNAAESPRPALPDRAAVAKASAGPDLPAVTLPASPPPVEERREASTPVLRAKLEQIVLADVSYDHVPLKEVVQHLIDHSKKLDPEQTGVNFLFGQAPATSFPLPLDPATGLPSRLGTKLPDLSSVIINLRPALRNVRLIDVLDAITRVADQPIQYSIKEYAVVFTLDANRIPVVPTAVAGEHRAQTGAVQLASLAAQAPAADVNASQPADSGREAEARSRAIPAAPLQTRAFKVNTNVFFSSIEKILGLKLNPGAKEIANQLRHDVFPVLGASLNSPEALLIYNDLTGILLVRGSAEELEAMQAAVETLGGTSTGKSAAKASGSSTFFSHLAEGPHTHLQRAVTGVFDALGYLAPPPFHKSRE